jgi:hypothetical protein
LASLGRFLPIAIAAVTVLAFVAGCGSGGDSAENADDGRNSSVAANVPVNDVPVRWASANARDLPTLLRSTGTVFVGRITALKGQHTQQIGRGAVVPGSGGPSVSFPITEFEVTVVRSLQSGLEEGSSLALEQPGGLITRTDGTPGRIALEGDEPIDVGKTYLIFGSVRADGVLTTTPFGRFVVENGRASPPEGWEHLPAAKQIAGRTIDDVALEVENAR